MQNIKKNMSLVVIAMIVGLFMATTLNSHAIKAYSGTVSVTQPDGTKISIKIHGDEFFNYYTTDNGQTITKKEDGYFYYSSYNSQGDLQISDIKVTSAPYMFNLAKGVPQHIASKKRAEAMLKFNEANEKPAIFAPSATKTNVADISKFPKKALVILVQYQDVKFTAPNPKQAFSDLMNLKGYSANGATGSVADYYEANSMGKYRPEFVVTEPVTLMYKQYMYAPNYNWQAHTIEACKLAQSQAGINFSEFDGDNDGRVDVVLIYFAGHNAAEGAADAVWPHKWAIPTTPAERLVLNGKIVKDYACASEFKGGSGTDLAGIGTMCHEFGHTLGLFDVYDTDKGEVTAAAMWSNLSLMDGGNYNNEGRTPPHLSSFERHMLGFLDIEVIRNSGEYSLEKIDNNKAYLIETPTENEYFYLENRQSTNWDKYIKNQFDSSDPKGMIIIHNDAYSNNYSDGITSLFRTQYNMVNAYQPHQCVDLEEASGSEYPAQPLANVFFPGNTNNKSFTPATMPSSLPWSGNNTGIYITNIRTEGDKVLFNVELKNIAADKAQFIGSVRDFKGISVPNADVRIYKAAPSNTNIFTMSHSGITTKASKPAYTTTTNMAGNFELINIEPGNYIVEASCPDYEIISTTVTCEAGQNVSTLTMYPRQHTQEWDMMKWYSSEESVFLGLITGGPLYTKVIFTPQDLARFAKNNLQSVRIRTAKNVSADIMLVIGNVIVAEKAFRNTDGSEIEFDLTPYNLKKDNKSEIAVISKFYDYSAKIGAVGYDHISAAIEGKGCLYSLDGNNWLDFQSNFMVGILLSDDITAPHPALSFSKASYRVGDEILLTLKNADKSEITSVIYKINGTQASSQDYTFTSAGSYVVSAEITYKSGVKVNIRRKINVK